MSLKSVNSDIEALQRHLQNLVRAVDSELTQRYVVRWPRRPPGLYWQLRWMVAIVLRSLEYMGIWRPDPWPVVLKQAHCDVKAQPVLIWAVGTNFDELRQVCDRLSARPLPTFTPVLVTDVADFTFFSRLGWLIEYLPRLAGEGEPYEKRKERFLARLYRGTPALPADAILEAGWGPDDIQQWLQTRGQKPVV